MSSRQDAIVSFRCKQCNCKLTGGISEIEHQQLRARGSDGEDLIERGLFLEADGLHPPELAGDYLLNLEDVKNTQEHPDPERSSGCCGPLGIFGLNLICINGHEIGTERSDCINPHYVILSATHVTKESWYQSA